MKCSECGTEIGRDKTFAYNLGGRNNIYFCNGPCLKTWIDKKDKHRNEIPEAFNSGDIKKMPRL